MEGETYSPSSWSRASEMFVSILTTTMKSYGLHCLTKENADALVEFLLRLAESKIDEVASGVVGDGDDKVQGKISQKEEEEADNKTTQLQERDKEKDISTADNISRLEEKPGFTLKAIPIHPDELVTKLDLEKLTDEINGALNMFATKDDVEKLRREVKERLDSLEDILKKIVAFQQGEK